MRLSCYALIIYTSFFVYGAKAQITLQCDTKKPCLVPGPINAGVNSQVPLTWQGRAMLEPQREPIIIDLVSNEGRFTAAHTSGDSTFGNNNTVIRTSLRPTRDGTVAFALKESLFIPGTISQQAAALGLRQLQYTRLFSFADRVYSGSYIINIRQQLPNARGSVPLGAEQKASAVNISRIALRFDSGGLAETISEHDDLRAIATLDYDGAGLFDAIWEVAHINNSSAKPSFRPIKNIRKYLTAGRQVTLQSPTLPSTNKGLYSVRLRLIEPSTTQGPILLRYQVSSHNKEKDIPVLNITVSRPSADMPLNSNTEFSWQTIVGSRAYQIELYEQAPQLINNQIQPIGAPLTGLQISSRYRSSRLSTSTLNYLAPGETYYWRVVAINSDGVIMAASPLREIRVEE